MLKWYVDREKIGRHSKFDALWSGPYVVISCKQANSFQLSRPNGEILPIPNNVIYINTNHNTVNGQCTVRMLIISRAALFKNSSCTHSQAQVHCVRSVRCVRSVQLPIFYIYFDFHNSKK